VTLKQWSTGRSVSDNSHSMFYTMKIAVNKLSKGGHVEISIIDNGGHVQISKIYKISKQK
jgi:hypothetical protein